MSFIASSLGGNLTPVYQTGGLFRQNKDTKIYLTTTKGSSISSKNKSMYFSGSALNTKKSFVGEKILPCCICEISSAGYWAPYFKEFSRLIAVVSESIFETHSSFVSATISTSLKFRDAPQKNVNSSLVIFIVSNLQNCDLKCRTQVIGFCAAQYALLSMHCETWFVFSIAGSGGQLSARAPIPVCCPSCLTWRLLMRKDQGFWLCYFLWVSWFLFKIVI